ncbi:proprotein convertase subtilisin/kexin type 9 isoform X1 [Lates japonicus]|uniref:Proprotein convertase subtilisin/kexin type 9 isoform X1 n=1 Tax=Lates japonicus TaxID=270547 RepID=A0AAD3N5V8_LATJO|nr:proprotein convertase subtilisin/kexin type 9 isoform X1 [Lates japonicus]
MGQEFIDRLNTAPDIKGRSTHVDLFLLCPASPGQISRGSHWHIGVGVNGVAQGLGSFLVRAQLSGKGTVSGALAGMEYIRATLADPVNAVVVLLPFIGGFSRSFACDLSGHGGYELVAAAAGNYREDTCLY